MIIIPPIINGKSYENADVSCTIMGTLFTSFTAISFAETLDDMKGLTGSGRDYVSYQNGKLTKSGSITLKLEEVKAIEDVAPNGKIYDIPLFPITVSFTDPTLVTKSYVLTAKFKGVKLETKDGDSGTDITLDLFVASIKKVA